MADGFDVVVRDRIDKGIEARLARIATQANSAATSLRTLNAAMRGGGRRRAGGVQQAGQQATVAAGRFQRLTAAVRGYAGAIQHASASTRAFVSNIRNVNGGFNALQRRVRGTGQALRAFASGVLLLGTAAGVASQVDAYQNLENKLISVTSSQHQLNATVNEMFSIAQRARVPVGDLGQLYRRTDIALMSLGASQKESLQITETISKLLTISGATTGEAASAMLQLSQAFNKGKLDGDEFRTVAEMMPGIMTELTNVMGISRKEIFDYSRQGKITSDVLREAFGNMADEVDAQIAKLPRTVGQAFTQLRNEITKTFGEWDKISGFTESISAGFDWLRNNLDVVGRSIRAFGAGFTVYLIPGIIAAIGPIRAFIAAIAAIPAAGAAYFGYFADQIKVAGSEIVTLRDLVTSFFQVLARDFMDGNLFGDLFTAEAAQRIYDRFEWALSGIGGWLRSASQHAAALVLTLSSLDFAQVKAALDEQFSVVGKTLFNAFASALQRLAGPIGKVAAEAYNQFKDKFLAPLQQHIRMLGVALQQLPAAFGLGELSKMLQGITFDLKDIGAIELGFTESIEAAKHEMEGITPVTDKVTAHISNAWTLAFKTIGEGFDKIKSDVWSLAENKAQDREVKKFADEWHKSFNVGDSAFRAATELTTQSTWSLTEALEALLNAYANLGAASKSATQYDPNVGSNHPANRSSGGYDPSVGPNHPANRGFSTQLPNFTATGPIHIAEFEKWQVQADSFTREGLEKIRSFKEQVREILTNFGGGHPENLSGQGAFGLDTMAQRSIEPLTQVQTLMQNIAGSMQSVGGNPLGQMTSPEVTEGMGVLQTEFLNVGTNAQTASEGISASNTMMQSLMEASTAVIETISGFTPTFNAASAAGQSFASDASGSMGQVSASARSTGVSISSSISSGAFTASSAIGNLASNAIADLNAIADAAANAASAINSIGGGGGSGTYGVLKSGFASGGYTGDIGRNRVAGVVHGQEYVMPAEQTAKYRPLLDAMRAGSMGTSGGATATAGKAGAATMNVYVDNQSGANIQVERLSETDVRIIAREESRRVVRTDSERVIASGIRNPNSEVSKSLQRNTKAERRR